MPSSLKYAVRALRRSPGFTLVAVVALALGIGANTTLFSIINCVFLQPLPYAEPDRLVRLASSAPERDFNHVGFSWTRYLAVRDGQQVFSSMGVAIQTAFTVTGRGDPEQVQGMQASADFLATLGVQPAEGRSFSTEEDQPGGPAVVLISQRYWRNHFDADRGVLGRTLTLDGRPYTIIGVLPASLSTFPLNQTDLWTPRPSEVPFLAPSQLEGGGFFFQVIARLKPGVSLAQAGEQVRVLATAYAARHPANADANSVAEVRPMLDDLVGDQRPTYTLLFGAVGCVLLIACANVANLLLARFNSRRKEIALRFALGADRRAVITQLLLESGLVALAGAGVGLLGARWGLATFAHLGRNFIPRAQEITLDPRALAFTVGLGLLTGLAMGLLPALHAARANANEALKDSSRGSTAGGAQQRTRGALLVTEIALSFVLLIGASLLLTSFVRLQRVAPGFEPRNVLIAFVNLPPTKYGSPAVLGTFYGRLVERLRTIPGVTSVGLNDSPPLAGNNGGAPVAVVGRPVPPLGERATAIRHLVTPGAFATLNIGLVRGRDFTERDRPDSPPVVIINESFAQRHFPGQDPVGQRLITGMGQKVAEIVGVVRDTRSTTLNAPPQPEYYLPELQRGENFAAILLRTTSEPAGSIASLRAALREVDPDLPLLNPQPYTTVIEDSVADRRLVMMLLSAFAVLALVLACIGVYSVVAYVVGQRAGEIGIRMALGASPGAVQRMILDQGLRLTAAGLGIGAAVAVGVTRLMQPLLYGVNAFDPLVYAGIALLLGLVAACACWLPARRVTRIDPLDALRAE